MSLRDILIGLNPDGTRPDYVGQGNQGLFGKVNLLDGVDAPSKTVTKQGAFGRLLSTEVITNNSIFGALLLTNTNNVNSGIFGYTLTKYETFSSAGIYGQVLFPIGLQGFKGTELTVAEVYEFSFYDGSIARFTSHSENIDLGNGEVFQAIPMQRSQISYHTNLEVDKVTVTTSIVGVTVGERQYTMPQVIRRDFLRNARTRIWAVDFENRSFRKLLFEGFITGDIGYNRGVLHFDVGSLLDRLQDKFPKLIYTEFCNHKFFDKYCGIKRDDREQRDVAGVGSDSTKIYSSIFRYDVHPKGYWTMGEIRIDNPNSLCYNVGRSIISHEDGYALLTLPYKDPVVEGDVFRAWPGCDKTGETCDKIYNNYSNFLGFEHIPPPSTLMP